MCASVRGVGSDLRIALVRLISFECRTAKDSLCGVVG